MTSPTITNSLLRLDGVTGMPPSPFERPNNKMDFFILELGIHNDVGRWCARTTEVLSTHAEFLRQMRKAGAEATRFVELAAGLPVLRLEAPFLKVLSDVVVSLECSHEEA